MKIFLYIIVGLGLAWLSAAANMELWLPTIYCICISSYEIVRKLTRIIRILEDGNDNKHIGGQIS
ncbi:hypothetical protein FACS1894217_10850 [Clostridia bacterium]|nr:hypothetical protein FACS1894217_10850 [Clostridia bacterium]